MCIHSVTVAAIAPPRGPRAEVPPLINSDSKAPVAVLFDQMINFRCLCLSSSVCALRDSSCYNRLGECSRWTRTSITPSSRSILFLLQRSALVAMGAYILRFASELLPPLDSGFKKLHFHIYSIFDIIRYSIHLPYVLVPCNMELRTVCARARPGEGGRHLLYIPRTDCGFDCCMTMYGTIKNCCPLECSTASTYISFRLGHVWYVHSMVRNIQDADSDPKRRAWRHQRHRPCGRHQPV